MEGGGGGWRESRVVPQLPLAVLSSPAPPRALSSASSPPPPEMLPSPGESPSPPAVCLALSPPPSCHWHGFSTHSTTSCTLV